MAAGAAENNCNKQQWPAGGGNAEAAADSRLYWTAALRGCPQRVNHAAVWLKPHVYSFGGFSSLRERQPPQRDSMDVLRLNAHTLRWSDVTLSAVCQLVDGRRQPQQRYGHTAVRYRGRAFVFGGRNDEAASTTHVCEFDPATLRWAVHPGCGTVPPARDGHSACVVRGHMLVFGGFSDSEEYDDQVYSCNLEQMEWTRIRPRSEPPSPRDFCCSVAWGNGFYMWGGRSDEAGSVHSGNARYDPSLYYFDADTRRWCRVQARPLPLGRRSGAMFRLQDRLYFGFGYNDAGEQAAHFGDLWCLDPSSGWVSAASPNCSLTRGPCPRRRMAAVGISRHRVLLFGGTSSAYSFQPPVDACSFRRLYAPLLASLPAFRRRDPEEEAAAAAASAAAAEAATAAGASGDAAELNLSHGGPAAQQNFMHEIEEPEDSTLGLRDISDMFLLEAAPSLQTLCSVAVIRYRLPLHSLHLMLQEDIMVRITDNSMSTVE